MKARKTCSGMNSVLIDPWRKNSRSCRDQPGTCAESFFDWSDFGWRVGVFSVLQETKNRKGNKRRRRKSSGFMADDFSYLRSVVKRRPEWKWSETQKSHLCPHSKGSHIDPQIAFSLT